MFTRLLVPLDGSTFSRHALPLAASIATRTGGTIRLVLVHTPIALPVGDIGPVTLLDQWESDHRVDEERYLEEQAEWLREQGLDVVTELRDGDVARELREASEDADLMVLATHGRGGIERAWLGSVADALIRHAAVPLLVVRPEEGEGGEAKVAPRPAPPPRHILAATGGSAAGQAAVQQAAGLARLFEARLTLLRIVAFPGGLASPYIPHAAEMDRTAVEQGEEQARADLDELAAGLTDLDVTTRVTQAYHAARGILAAIEEEGADILAVGTHRRSALGRAVLGSTADKVVRASPVPVLVEHRDE